MALPGTVDVADTLSPAVNIVQFPVCLQGSRCFDRIARREPRAMHLIRQRSVGGIQSQGALEVRGCLPRSPTDLASARSNMTSSPPHCSAFRIRSTVADPRRARPATANGRQGWIAVACEYASAASACSPCISSVWPRWARLSACFGFRCRAARKCSAARSKSCRSESKCRPSR